jgi:hypothetical protein
MNTTRMRNIVALMLTLALCSAALAAQAVEIKLKDGSRWRGELNSTVQVTYMQQNVQVPLEGKLIKVEPMYVVVDGKVAGNQKQVTIFRSDIISMTTVTAPVDGETPEAPTNAPHSKPSESKPATKAKGDPTQPGVFVLPLEGGVGETLRHEEIVKMTEYLDKNYGPGQIVVFLISSNGGSVAETEKIGNAIREMRKRHRAVAWIDKAISAGCQTAMYCNEIYFMTTGTAGAVTAWNPGTGQSVKGEMLEKINEDFVRVAEENGYSRWIALSMKNNHYLCSYDKDPVTGEVTFYGDLSGQYVLSDANSNLCFNASNALHCGFSDGTADTPEQLAKLLNLPKWNEIDDYGRRLAKEWQRICEEAKTEIPLAAARYRYKNVGSGDAMVVLGTRIQIIEDLIRWWNRCHNVAQQMLPSKDDLEREVVELKKQLADIKRRSR